MPQLDAQTTIEIAAAVCAVFALAGLVLGPAIGATGFILRLVSSNAIMFGALMLGATGGPTGGLQTAAAMMSLWTAAVLIIVSALRMATRQAVRDSVLLIGTLAAVSALFTCAFLADTMHPISIVSPLCIAATAAWGIVSARGIRQAHLSRIRYWLMGTFIVAFGATIAHLPERISDWRADSPDPVQTGLTYLSMLLVWTSLNTGLILTVALDLLHTVDALSQRDELTDALNRRGMANSVALQQFRASGPQAALVMIDIDHFKRVNDTHGHSIGDAVLRWFAGELRRFLREGDLLVRLGGEEFGLVLPQCTQAQALEVAQRIRHSFDDKVRFSAHAVDMRVTASFGVAGFDAERADIDESLGRADQALYAAKRAGRNRVATWPPSRPETQPDSGVPPENAPILDR